MDNKQKIKQIYETIFNADSKSEGKISPLDFRPYILCALFYRFISENLTNYINTNQEEAGEIGFNYADFSDEEAEDARDQMVAEKGFFILPSQLFCNVCKDCENDDNLNERLYNIFRSIEGSAIGRPSEDNIKGIFSDFNVNNPKLAQEVIPRSKLLAKLLLIIQDIDLDETCNNSDNFGDAYESLITDYAKHEVQKGDNSFTPKEVSEVLARIVAVDGHEINSCYDPACGSGSLLLKFSKIIGKKNPFLRFYGQEIDPNTYNLCRINMFLHNINYDKFDIKLGDTLTEPKHRAEELFDAIVSNPPYSNDWAGDKNQVLRNDDRFSPAGALAPKDKSDLAFVMHILNSLSDKGTAAVAQHPGVLFRGGTENTIRTWLIKNNFIDTVIQLPKNLFDSGGIAPCIIVLRKDAKQDSNILFIDASKLFVKVGKKNKLTEQNMDAIVNAFAERKEQQYFTRLVSNDDVLTNDSKVLDNDGKVSDDESNLSVSRYVEQEYTREEIDINQLDLFLDEVTQKGIELRIKIKEITKDL